MGGAAPAAVCNLYKYLYCVCACVCTLYVCMYVWQLIVTWGICYRVPVGCRVRPRAGGGERGGGEDRDFVYAWLLYAKQ